MRRIFSAALAAATMLAPISFAGDAAADNGRHRGWDRHHDDDRDDYDDDDYYEDRHHDWDDRRYNGYYRNGYWHYGPPPGYYRDVRYGYRGWRRGETLPYYYRTRYRPVDYNYYRVAPPPNGYHYVRNDDNGELLLVGIATGVILGVILAGE